MNRQRCLLLVGGAAFSLMTLFGEPIAAAQAWLASVQIGAFQVPKDLGSWERERTEIRRQLETLLGRLPPRPHPLEVTTLWRRDEGDYWLEKIQFNNGAGADVPGYIFVPKGLSAKAPAILYCHWHGGQYDLGKEEMLESQHTPTAPGPALARRGYVVLGIDAYGFGERNGQGPGGSQEKGAEGEVTASKFELWTGRTLWGMIVRDDLIALDYLAQRSDVDAQRIGVTGISMGATRTWWLMALDERLKCGVAVDCLTRYQDLIKTGGLKYHGIYYWVPNLLEHFDTEAVVALIAPRPVLFMTGDRDGGSPESGVRAIDRRVRPVYRLYGKEDAFENLIYPGVGHVYLPDMWERMTAWMDQHLNPKP